MEKTEHYSKPILLIPVVLSLIILSLMTGCDRLGGTLNEPPAGMINLPRINAEFAKGDYIAFDALCMDEEDGMLEGDALVWTSNIDGELGRGDSITRDDLSVGTHTITLTMRDSGGSKDKMSIKIHVLDTGG